MRQPPSVFDLRGRRKYLTSGEMERVMALADHHDDRTRAFFRLMAETGCRISEALAMQRECINFTDQYVVIESLKKRQRGIFRMVPISEELSELLDAIAPTDSDARIWPWVRMTGWRRLHMLFEEAGISGPQASPKGLRHGFAVAAVRSGAPLSLVQHWLGHSDIRTTSIYTMIQGAEEREMARKTRGVFLGEPPARAVG